MYAALYWYLNKAPVVMPVKCLHGPMLDKLRARLLTLLVCVARRRWDCGYVDILNMCCEGSLSFRGRATR